MVTEAIENAAVHRNRRAGHGAGGHIVGMMILQLAGRAMRAIRNRVGLERHGAGLHGQRQPRNGDRSKNAARSALPSLMPYLELFHSLVSGLAWTCRRSYTSGADPLKTATCT